MTTANGSPPATGIPPAMQAEHREIHEQLARAARLEGPVGEAARALARLLHPHFEREEEVALPPLGALAPLARGERPVDADAVRAMSDTMRGEMDRMVGEHEAIRAAAQHMRDVARRHRTTWVAALADTLAHHAQMEEEVFYPAAVVVGDLLRDDADGGTTP